MNRSFPWLPNLFEYKLGMDKQQYIEAVYELFKNDFINNDIYFDGEKLGIKYMPIRDGKEAGFYHIVSEGEDEENRNIDLKRCERIKWIKPILESNYTGLKKWSNVRKRQNNILIYFEEIDYLIILRERNGYRLLWTAYPITYPKRREKLLKEYNEYLEKITQ